MNFRQLKIWRDQHAPLLEQAVAAITARLPFAPFSDELTSYDKTLIEQGEQQFMNILGSRFQVGEHKRADQTRKWVGGEISPYGFPLGITYRAEDFKELAKRANHAMKEWERLSVSFRAAVLCEAISKIHDKTFLFSHIGMHTSGHGFFMGFHANAIHAQARALESVANVYQIEKGLDKELHSEFVIGDGPPQRIQSSFRSKPLGLSLVYSGQVVPTWGAYPAIFASLAAGCPVITIPHSNAVLPIALTVRIIKSVCTEAGISQDIVNIFCSDDEKDYRAAALHPSVKIIDYMGKSEFGDWLRQHAWHARVLTQQSSYTPIFVHSTVDYDGMIENLAFGLCSYSAQLCTSPQNIYVLREGIRIPGGNITVEKFQSDLVAEIDMLIQKIKPSRELLGAIADVASVQNIHRFTEGKFGRVLRSSKTIIDPDFEAARIMTPLVLTVRSPPDACFDTYAREITGPVSFVIDKDDFKNVVKELRNLSHKFGLLGVGLYTTDAKIENAMKHIAADIGALLSINFCQNYYISQCAVFTDIHGGSINPSSNVTYGAPLFYHSRLRLTESRKIF
ncbi:aldehyde dehydrogenase family protein [Xenorhabdus bovienii]|uniref:Aldehyde dehydrogenase family protein n=1 Tax=Xenorhabdus bovienii TaxID=40576 RepID=A0AAJ1MX46_XENBV|nr:aldehyde dehydrogenase family protein [Xenorhabdus bovienii]MDE1473191.1 aldehyde dehydrogenase family protein [Xenorhabdus bovienii]MDE1476919.1 aldehyde dehydrogenase family protein [Xenorhabdus bovienii]MDE1481930.1 aldehyde dehydrogenase family protein [Xenorhabdus bovienii]MDE1485263.1 aldehyde dehydrogenase family protein [Xenorhabdus bovienii]MDE1490799.1 aldehyde dehydrogenase family protein [Xenorhabdus bovienii]